MKRKKGLIFLFILMAVIIYSLPVFSEEQVIINDKDIEENELPNNDNEQQKDSTELPNNSEQQKDNIEIPKDNSETQNDNTELPKDNKINENPISIFYQTHVQDIGWQKYVKNGEVSGTSHQSKRLEAIKIKIINSPYDGNVEYSTHVQDIGWLGYVKNDAISGTSGQSKRLEAIRIRLTGEIANHYDIYYRVHAQEFGWLDWAKNGESAGTSGYSYRLEAIEIKLIEKGNSISLKTDCAYKRPFIFYQTHIQEIGWQENKYDGGISGTSGQSKRLEAIKINLKDQEYEGNIEYQSYIENIGWQNYVKNGEMSGTSGRSLRLEAIKIKLTGEMANHYDIYYRVHVENFGWLDWAKNGESAGTGGYSYRMEAIMIQLVKKGTSAPGSTVRPYVKRLVKYNGYQNKKWLDYKYDGEILGNIGKPLESIQLYVTKAEYTGAISYATYTTESGWQKSVSSGNISNKLNSKIEAIKMNITGEIANHYDIFYSVYISNIGWTGWGKNNELCGNVGYGNNIQALKVKLLPKNSNPGNTSNVYIEDDLKVKYTSYVEKSQWQNYVSNGDTSGTTGQSKSIQGIKILINKKTIPGDILYSTHVSDVGWQKFFSNNEQGGVIGKKIEAIKIKLSGELANKYNIYYRVHVSNVGWMGWTSNGEAAGTSRAGLGVEAIQIQLLEKNQPAPENNNNPKTTKAYLEAVWKTDASGNTYYYDIFGNMVKGGSYKIGNSIYYFSPTGILLGDKELEVIDVSAHNGVIDWKKVSESGIYGAILRISASAVYEDKKLADNINGVKKYNIPYGIYIYSYAEDYLEGIAYANFTKSMIAKYNMNPTLGIFLDLESNSITQFMGTTEYTAVVKGYLSVIPNAELYTYVYYSNTALNTPYMRDRITWIAHYNSYCGYTGNYRMWQYTSSGSVSGVSGVVDKSKLYR